MSMEGLGRRVAATPEKRGVDSVVPRTETAETKKEGILVLPDNPKLRKALETKLKEYQERLRIASRVPLNKLPYGYTQDHKYRIEILRRLLASKEHQVDVLAYAQELIRKKQAIYEDLYEEDTDNDLSEEDFDDDPDEEDFDKEIFMRACLVINDYLKEGKSIRYPGTGTGLTFPEEPVLKLATLEDPGLFNPDGTRKALAEPELPQESYNKETDAPPILFNPDGTRQALTHPRNIPPEEYKEPKSLWGRFTTRVRSWFS